LGAPPTPPPPPTGGGGGLGVGWGVGGGGGERESDSERERSDGMDRAGALASPVRRLLARHARRFGVAGGGGAR